jgi:hypothetical protein
MQSAVRPASQEIFAPFGKTLGQLERKDILTVSAGDGSALPRTEHRSVE